jgi:small subunit ribosomal protein S20
LGAGPLANIKQSLKRARQSEKHRVINKWQVTRMNTFIKNVLTAITGKNVEAAKEAYRQATSVIDKMVTKGLIHKNKADRHKSRLNKKIVALAG